MKKSIVIILFLISIFFSACSQKITVKAIIPAPIGDKDIKNVSIEKFTNDNIGLSQNVNSSMSEISFDEKNYFNIINRIDTDKILAEQKLQDSGLVNNKGEESFGLSDISSIISGKVNSKTYNKRSYLEERTDYNTCIQYRRAKDGKEYCALYRKYKIRCNSYSYSVSADIKITRVSNSDIIFSKTFVKSTSQNRCSDSSSSLSSKQIIYEMLSRNIADEFVSFIAPSYKYLSLVLIEDEDIDYTNTQENMLKNSLKLIELKDIKSANTLLLKLVNSTKYQSSTALYNLGITYEYMGELHRALNMYQKAKNITLLNDMDENIINAVIRIKKSIDDKNKVNKQIEN